MIEAQKFGHINSAVIIEQHPKVAVAHAALESFQKMLVDSFTLKAKAFEDEYRLFVSQASDGTLSKMMTDKKQAELVAKQQSLKEGEEQLQFRILQKREALLQPILSEVDSIIQSIGKQGNYTMIFDTSVPGALLFAVDSEDLSEMVKTGCMEKP